MKDQHKQIKGYRDLSQEEINLMNKIKALAEQVGELVDELEKKTAKDYQDADLDEENACEVAYSAIDWVSSGKKDLQLGFMQLVRAVAKPQSF